MDTPDKPPEEVPAAAAADMPPPVEEFPEHIPCPQCRRPYRVEGLRMRVNTTLTEMQLSCPQCRRRLRNMRLKDWYDHYVQGQTAESPADVFVKPPIPTIPERPQRPDRQERSGTNERRDRPQRRHWRHRRRS